MVKIVMKVENLSMSYGGVVATDNVSFDVRAGEVHAIIGPNGAGKTTLLSQLSGLLKPDRGHIYFPDIDITQLSAPRRAQLGLARTFQLTTIFQEFTVLQNVCIAVQATQGSSFKFFKRAEDDESLIEPAEQILGATGLTPFTDDLAGNLAHGQQRQLELAMALATTPQLLLLDEPLAGMGGPDSKDMVSFLRTLKHRYAMLLVEHDMDAVFTLADRISVLVYGRIIASGDPDTVRNDPSVREAYLGEE